MKIVSLVILCFQTMKYLLIILLFYCLGYQPTNLKPPFVYSPIIFEREPKGVFLFTKNWAYPQNTVKDDNGKFSKADGEVIARTDTAHLYFTANCKTNVQGGYPIRYCYASKKGKDVTLNFSDGLPAYGSSFDVTLEGNRFKFVPNIVYSALNKNEKVTYRLTGDKLVIYQKKYYYSKMISGYIDAEFTENGSDTKTGYKYKNHLYFRG